MNLDDVVYLMLLFFSIGVGYFYRPIKNIQNKKAIGTALGLFIVLIVSGLHIAHNLVFVLLNSIIILYTNKTKCHILSFLFSFAYLIFFRTTAYFGIPYPPAHTNLVQMMLTLKLIGLAFEVHRSHKTDQTDAYDEIKPSFVDIFHYSFNYVGVLTGPYYRFRTFQDYFNLPFHEYADWRAATINKLKYVPLYAVLFLWGTYNWPLSYALTDEFYTERSWLYRLWYIWPNFFIFRMRIYIGLVLSECVCTMSGLGVYPAFTEPKPGMGPSQNTSEMLKLFESGENVAKTDYSFETIHNISPYNADFCTTCREGMKNWNICVQYWLAVNVYKEIPFRKFRTGITMFVSAVWHGVYSGYYVCICSVPLYLLVEDVYVKLFLKDNQEKSAKIWEWILWFLKMLYFSYMAIAFHLLEVKTIFHYYNSVYHFCAVFGVVLYLIGLYMLNQKKIIQSMNVRQNLRRENARKDL